MEHLAAISQMHRGESLQQKPEIRRMGLLTACAQRAAPGGGVHLGGKVWLVGEYGLIQASSGTKSSGIDVLVVVYLSNVFSARSRLFTHGPVAVDPVSVDNSCSTFARSTAPRAFQICRNSSASRVVSAATCASGIQPRTQVVTNWWAI